MIVLLLYFLEVAYIGIIGFPIAAIRNEGILTEYFGYALICMFVFVLCSMLSYKMFRFRNKSLSKIEVNTLGIGLRVILPTTYVLSTFILIFAIGDVPLLISGYHSEAKAELVDGLNAIFIFLNILNVFYLAGYAICAKKVSLGLLSKILYISIPLVCMGLLNERGSILAFVIELLIVSFYSKPFKLVNVFATLFLVSVLVFAIGISRNYDKEKSISDQFVNVLVSEISVETSNFVSLIEVVPKYLEFTNGSTFLSGVILAIPRVILPTKNEILKPAGVVYKEYFQHEYIRVGERITLPGELYLNFGFLGVALGGGIYGLLLKKLTLLLQSTNSPYGIAALSCIACYSVLLMQGDFASVSYVLYLTLVPFWLVCKFLHIRLK